MGHWSGRIHGLLRAIGWLSAALLSLAPPRGSQAATARWQALIAPSGQVQLLLGRRPIATITPGLMEAGWHPGKFSPAGSQAATGNIVRSALIAPGGTAVDCELEAAAIAGGVRLAYKLTPRSAVTLNSLHVALDFPIEVVAGGEFVVDGQRGTIPVEFGTVSLVSKPASSLELNLPAGTPGEGGVLRLDFPAPTPLLLQDNRRWGPSFSARVGPHSDEGRSWPAGEPLNVAFELKAKEGIEVEYDGPVTIEAGSDWIPLAVELDIMPGSALDFSGMGHIEAPAGKHGWLTARPDGTFAFEDEPTRPRRFYGVNLCFTAHYIPHDDADRLADRLARLGYNAVRFHHYERDLVDRSGATTTTCRSDRLDQLDYLFAALKKRGIYVTTDLFVSRPVLAGEVWDGGTGDVGMDNFKMLVPVNARAFENWKAFARNLLTHVNPYTGLSYAADPALAWLSMINEGNFGNYFQRLDPRVEPDWVAAWNAFLTERYGNREALERAWGSPAAGDPRAGTVPLFKEVYSDTPRGRDLAVFLATVERDMFARMRKFLRDELGVKALLTDMNGWAIPLPSQAARAEFDYVDEHFYVDHPEFIERQWRLPSRSANASPVAGGAAGGRQRAFVRLMDKPFTVTEFNYAGPARCRGVGGMITGTMAALQGWGGLWRFAYSHSRDNLFKPSPAGYFDLATDPLNLASERAAICLFARGDMAPAPHAVAIAMTPDQLLRQPGRNAYLSPDWHSLALVTRIGTFLGDPAGRVPADLVLPLAWGGPSDPYASSAGRTVLETMRERGWLAGNQTELSANRLQSETGELLVDAPRDVLVLNTPKTAGGYVPEGESIAAGAVSVAGRKTDATVWVSSVDGEPSARSRRLIITHLTELQNTGARFGERAQKTLLAWGTTPHLVRAGAATVSIRLQNPERARVWALATSGRRVAPVPAQVRGGELVVELNVAGPEGARMVYEVEVQ